MSGIFKEFYRGNLSPADRQMVKGSTAALSACSSLLPAF